MSTEALRLVDREFARRFGRVSRSRVTAPYRVEVVIGELSWRLLVKSIHDFRTASPHFDSKRLRIQFLSQQPLFPEAKKLLMASYLTVFQKYDRDIERQIDALGRKFGVGLSELDLPRTDFTNRYLSKITPLAGRPLRTALIVGQYRGHMLKTVHSFLLRSQGSVDVYFPPKAGEIPAHVRDDFKVVDRKTILQGDYDCIVSFGGAGWVDRNRLSAPQMILLLTNHDHMSLKNGRAGHFRRLRGVKLRAYNLFRSTLTASDFGALGRAVDIARSIDWAADMELDFDFKAAVPVFDFIFFGGNDRDFKSLYDMRGLFKSKRVVIVKSDFAGPAERTYVERLSREPNFLCLEHCEYYERILLHSRACIVLFKGRHRTDYTSLCDASWYGKPVITNRVTANRHLEDVLLITDGSRRSMRSWVQALDDPAFYARRAGLARRHALKNQNLAAVLLDVCRNMR